MYLQIAGQFHFRAFRLEHLMTTSFKILLISSAFLAGCDDQLTKVEIDPDTGFETIYAIRKEDNIYHGPFTKSDSTGVLLERGAYVGGKLHGIREILYADGQVKVRERYDEDVITDLYEYYFPNGNHELKGYYISGAMYGPWQKFNEEGKLIEVVTMVNNEELGPFTEYHDNGQIQAQGAYLHGPNENGTLNLFDESGELYKTMLCDSGRCITAWEKK